MGILSIASLVFSIYLLAKFSFQPDIGSSTQTNLIITTISSFNIAIFLGWLSFGLPMGLTISILAALIVIWADLRANLNGYSIFTLQFFATALFGYEFLKARIKLDNSYNLKLEKISEERNLIINSIREREENILVLERKLDRYSILKEVVEALSTRVTLDEISAVIIEKAGKIVGKEDRILLYFVDTEKQALMLSASKGPVKIMAKTGDVFDHWVFRNRKTLMVEDVKTDFRFSTEDIEESKSSLRSLVEVPLLSEDKVIGILRMDSAVEYMYVQDDLRLLDIIADLGAVAIQNALLIAKTEELAIRDGVTGLVVRRYFMERFQEEVRRAAMKKDVLSILILDIDHFKNYNDKYGHAAGDLVLKHLANLLNSMVGEGDIVARYGGEEMVILLCGKDKDRAVSIAEEIREAVKNKPLVLRRHTANITVSIGVAAYPNDAVLEEELIKIADERLYKAKEGGRDMVC
ncbi:MAG: sensor domain-containing diguanylate cyclase [Candidatus Omnitrophota bacterium]